MTLYTGIQRRRLAVRREDWLPEEFTRVLAIGRPNGNVSYIDTGLRLDPNAEYTIMFSNPGYDNTSTTKPIFGGGYSKTDTTFAIWSGTASTGGFSASFGKAQSDAETGYVGGADVTKWHVVRADCRNHSLYCDDALIGTSSNSYVSDNASRSYKMVLFGCWRQSSSSSNVWTGGMGAIAWFQARSNGALVRDMVPVIRNAEQDSSGSEIGFWDRCGNLSPSTGTPFYTFNQHTGIDGGAMWRYGTALPGYRKVLCIESATGTRKMELHTPKVSRRRVFVDYYMPSCEGPRAIFGSKVGLAFWPTDGDGGWRLDVRDNTLEEVVTYRGSGTFFGRHEVEVNINSLVIDGNVVLDDLGSRGGNWSDNTLFVFGSDNQYSNQDISPAGSRIYRILIDALTDGAYDRVGGGTGMGELVPVVRESDGYVGFYDAVDQRYTFHPPDAVGGFRAEVR